MADHAPLLLLTAMAEEHQALRGHIDNAAPDPRLAAYNGVRGTIAGRPVVLALCGIGKVNAAIAIAQVLPLITPSLVIMTGVAGGLDPALQVGDVVVSRRLVMFDYGNLNQGWITPYRPGVPPIPGFSQAHGYDLPPDMVAAISSAIADLTLPLTHGIPHTGRVVMGTVLTGDVFLNCTVTRERLFTQYHAQAVEMEAAAAAQAAQTLGNVPCLTVRALSDLAGAGSEIDFPTFLPAAAARAATVAAVVAAAV